MVRKELKLIYLGLLVISFLISGYGCSNKGTVAQPEFNLTPGKYENEISVELSSKTKDARIFYTVNGKKPSHMSKEYSEGIKVRMNQDIFIQAIAIKKKYKDSTILQGKFSIREKSSEPVFSLEPGKYRESFNLYISQGLDSKIYYTLDGSTPTDKSSEYNYKDGIFIKPGVNIVKAICYSSNKTIDPSNVISGTYIVDQNIITFSPVPGKYDYSSMLVSINSVGDTYYTLDGSEPTLSSSRYTSPIEITPGTRILKARVIVNNYIGEISEGQYIIGSSDEIQGHLKQPDKINKYIYYDPQKEKKQNINTSPPIAKQKNIREEKFDESENTIEAEDKVSIYKTYGGERDDKGKQVLKVTDGYLLVGYSDSKNFDGMYSKGRNDFLAIKLSKSGNIIWQRLFGTSSDDFCYSACETSDGSYILAGYTTKNQNSSLYLVKINSSGETIWEKNLQNEKNSYGYYIEKALDGGYILCGASRSSATSGYDVLVKKIDESGNIVWEKTYGGKGDDYAYQIKKSSDNKGYIIIGSSNSTDLKSLSQSKGFMDVYCLKISIEGNVEWENLYGGSKNDLGYSIESTKDGGYIIAGSSEGDLTIKGFGKSDLYLNKINSKGKLEWNKLYGASEDDYGYSIKQTEDSKYIVAGFTYTREVSADNLYIVKFSENGSPVWEKRYEGMGSSQGYYIERTYDKGYIILGHSFGRTVNNLSNKGDIDYLLVKINSNGETQ